MERVIQRRAEKRAGRLRRQSESSSRKMTRDPCHAPYLEWHLSTTYYVTYLKWLDSILSKKKRKKKPKKKGGKKKGKQIYTHICVYVYLYIYVCMYMHVYVYIYMYTYMCMYLYVSIVCWGLFLHFSHELWSPLSKDICEEMTSYGSWSPCRCLACVIDSAWDSAIIKRERIAFLGSFDWCCLYYPIRNSLVALLEALFAQTNRGTLRIAWATIDELPQTVEVCCIVVCYCSEHGRRIATHHGYFRREGI